MKLAGSAFKDLRELNSKTRIHLIEPMGGMNHFEETFLNNINQKVIDDIKDNKCLLVISSVAEGNINCESLRNIHLILDNHKLPPKNVLFIQSNYNLQKQYDEMCNMYNVQEKINILITQHKLESCIESYVQMINGEWDFKVYPKEPSINLWEDVEKILDKPRDYYYLSYNKTLRPDREALLSLMLKEDLIKKGLVSIGLKESNTFDFIKDNIEEVQKWSNKLKELQPLNVSGEPPISSLDEGKYKGLNVCGYTYGDQFRRVYFMVVTEDVFEADSMFFSQTTYKPIVSLTPFIMFGSPYMMKNLREIQGFKTFSPWIDESYDEEENHEKRLYMIVNEIKRLCSISKEKMNKWYYEMKDVLIYNQNHLLNFKLEDYSKIYNYIYNK